MPEWVAAGRFFRTYEQVVLLRGAAGRGTPQATAPALDAAELVGAALDALASDPELLAAERARVRHLLVDDAQDLDPQQLELVRVLGRTARTVLLAGDPDQAVLGFRGADPAGLDAVDAPTAVLTVDHRARPAIRSAVARLAARLPGAGPARTRVGPDDAVDEADGQVQVCVFGSAAQEAAWIADGLRRAHLQHGVPWSQMAVLSRSARRTLPVLRRALLAAGVPIAVPPDELPLARQSAVVPLLMVLRYAARPGDLDADAATALLTSPLGSADPMRLRRLRRGLLRLHAAGREARENAGGDAAPHGDGPAADGVPSTTAADDERIGSDPLLVEALRAAALGRPDPLSALPAFETAPLRRVGALLAVAGEAIREGAGAEQVLWRIWQGTNLEQRWVDATTLGGPVGAAADRDLDAVLALFDSAARHADRLPGADVSRLRGVPRRPAAAGRHARGRAPDTEAVALLTAHAARGREWRVVAVPGVQEGAWPDLRLRGSLLGNERLVDVVAGVAEPAAAVSRIAPLLAEERRLFYVACSRARETLLVSAVQADRRATGGEQPSRFLDELDPTPDDGRDRTDRSVHKPGRALLLAELVGELRRAVCSPEEPGEEPHARAVRAARRSRAAVQLARLARAGVPGAAPDDWYGLAPLSTDAPLRAPGEVVPVSPSDVEKILRCPLRWMMERHGGGEIGALSAVTGTLVHALVQAGAAGADGAELEGALQRRVAAARPRRALVRPPRAGPGAGDARGVRRLGPPEPGRRAAARRGRASRAARPGRPRRCRHRGPAGAAAARPRGPAGGRRFRSPGRGRREDGPHGRHPPGRCRASAARRLPARRRAGRVHRAGGRGGGPGWSPAGLPRRPVGVRRGQGARAASVGRRRAGAVEAAGPGLRRGDGGFTVPRARGAGLRPMSGSGELPGERVRSFGHGWVNR